MTARGVFGADREIFEDPSFAKEPFSEREAFLWLIAEAAWKDRKKRIGNVTIDLERGQLAASLRYLASTWQWSKSRVDRYLRRLVDDAKIGTASGTAALVITVREYNRIQNFSPQSGTLYGTAPGHARDNYITKETKNPVPEDQRSSGCPTAPLRAGRTHELDFERDFWSNYPTDRNMSKREAAKVWRRMLPARQAMAVAALPIFREYCTADPTYRPLHARKFLAEERFVGFLEAKGKVVGMGVFIEEDSLHWPLWAEHYRATKGRRPPVSESIVDGKTRRGWWFPSETPPLLQRPETGRDEAAG